MSSVETHQALSFKKTRWMNLIGGAVISILALGGSIVRSVGHLPLSQIVVGLVLMSFFALVAFGTARALSQSANVKLVKTMLWLNWSMIGFYALGVVATVLGTFASPDVMIRMLVNILPAALILVVPQTINVIALKTVRSMR
ncbi:hypothetical protein CD175_22250 [Pseudomonas laurylsulfatiphila]|uniref:Uncharacterized protein n=1 Tax=Pseudomonas laurylsulfatiphila TaxID=2011015 RepID=A0A2S6FG01_9PSED|nr:hypothetical protein [Pseudomonas laurylsulfatiphila]PPK36346.1 hypothetical protein CD175_22250 [Pseudomonas laurylsulfatiphila]